jgi:ATP-dependent DNA helicase RecG
LEQIKAVDEILEKMAAPQVANHMLMGDVGCGKTIVSAFGLAAAKDTGGQAFMLAPTEVLATQHFASLGSMLEAAGISVALLCGSTPAAVRESILERLKTGELDVLIGTHALLEDDVRPKNLTFAIIDEQQRFGVEQRAKLLSKGGAVDALSLSATPIPRSLAIATLGNFSISVIKHPARAHAPRVTRVVRKTDRGEAYEAAYKELEVGHQVYVVCPLIGTSDNSQDSDSAKSKSGAAKHKAGAQSSGFDTLPDDEQEAFVDIDDFEQWSDDNPTAAIREARFLEQKIFCPYKVAVLHGGMHADKKAQVMSDFAEGNVQVLVSTTVIEVGIDVAAATVMIIEDADRFGLSQLHQLRGRVGRGGDASQVFLVSSTKREEALARLDYLTHCDNGFELAEFDLSLRREGDILGSRQSGASSLKLVSIARDGDLIDAAWTDAAEILKRDPMLEQPSHKAIAREIEINIEEKVRQEQAQTQARAKAKSGSRSNSKKVHK